jgi:hypothetical protein
MNCSAKKVWGGSGGGCAACDLRGRRALEEPSGWQVVSSLRTWSATMGSAGRRLEALFSGGLARSFAPGASAGFERVAGRAGAASLRDSVSGVAQTSAARGGVGHGEMIEGTGERASQGVLNWVTRGRATPGPAWRRGCDGDHDDRDGREAVAPGGVITDGGERDEGRLRGGSRFTF